MAFIDFRAIEGTALEMRPAALPALTAHASTEAEDLSPFEWRVVQLAKEDGRDTLVPRRKRGWFGRLIFGPQPPSRELANERLEALRRLAVHAWHDGYLVPVSAIKDAVRMGYTELQAGRVIDSIVEQRHLRKGAAA
jgi:hypothetical protein